MPMTKDERRNILAGLIGQHERDIYGLSLEILQQEAAKEAVAELEEPGRTQVIRDADRLIAAAKLRIKQHEAKIAVLQEQLRALEN